MTISEPFFSGRINIFVGANNCGKTQLLKDMLAYITGTRTPTVILNKLEISYPETWSAIEQSYDMKIVETNQSQQLRHIAPTLDSAPAGSASSDILNILSNWLAHDKHAFHAATGAGFVTYLNTDNRLKLAMSQPVHQNLQMREPQNVLETLYMSGSSSTETVRECVRKIFGILYASLLIEMDFNILMVSQRLGHEKVETTWQTYAHLYPDKEKLLAARLDTVKVRGITANLTIEDQLTTFMTQFQNHINEQPTLIDISSEEIIQWNPQKKKKPLSHRKNLSKPLTLVEELMLNLQQKYSRQDTWNCVVWYIVLPTEDFQ